MLFRSYPSIHPSIHLPTHPSTYLPIYPSIHLSTHPSTYPSTHPSTCLFILLPVHPLSHYSPSYSLDNCMVQVPPSHLGLAQEVNRDLCALEALVWRAFTHVAEKPQLAAGSMSRGGSA